MSLSGFEKAALVLATVGVDTASEIMKHLDDSDIKGLGNFLGELPKVDQRTVEQTYKEFLIMHGELDFIPSVDSNYTKDVLIKALGVDKADKVLEFLDSDSSGGIDILKWLDTKTIVSMLKVEHPQTVALILTNLEAKQAAAVFDLLPERLKGDALYRMATIDTISPEVIGELEDVIQRDVDFTGSIEKRLFGGKKFVADILNLLSKSGSEEAIKIISSHNDQLAEDIQGMMFIFTDLEKLDDRSIRELLKDIDREDLVIAMKGASEVFKDMVFKNMSSRAVELLKEDMESKGPVKLSDVEKSQQKIVNLSKKLADEGKIVLGGEGEEVVF